MELEAFRQVDDLGGGCREQGEVLGGGVDVNVFVPDQPGGLQQVSQDLVDGR